ncbi:MAG TPA: FAD-linked oxidase C-terminal domain-containing protein [Nitrosomonas sp.]|nr:FAD-linked oxidase C-terminal domain-containing protein [Nitrosomonas sp.]HQX12602.1 FAD-linked oxidase C-terminal domain-containing protein [Nitrosomonas sp.]HRB32210.1 FAD-linked oxidase C-terminal domain-containing protein [Nitrosomonas sp.]HRB44872.1 FAD-linked oxidase C-terminal domain-containing protein [Nitrosomonas sp.]HRB77143.1 FAD-linked oxidase C-terminal domain-containing protein [Nitrosomonas sp.]
MLPAKLVAELHDSIPPDRFYTDPVDCYAYSYDNSRKIFPPDGVLFPLTCDEIQHIVKLCNQYQTPLIPRGRGTGTAGGSLPEKGGIALSMERMLNIVSVDPANRVIVTEPGVLNQSIQDTAKPHGFFWPPDPSSAAFSTVGGNIATSAGGPHAVKYGTTREHVLGLKAVTGTGKLITTGCYTTKGVVGYDLTRLLIGSEGTLAVIAEATLKLTALPSIVAGITAHFRDLSSCAAAIVNIMSLQQLPSALEFLDIGSLNLIRNRYPEMLPADTHAMLMIEVDGSRSDVPDAIAAIIEACQNNGLISATQVTDTGNLWKARKALSPLLREIAPKKINEDVVVPVSTLPEFLNGIAQLSTQYQLNNVNFGHAGNGNIHVNLLINPDNSEEVARAERCLDEIFNLVIKLRGTLSGEHGVGSEKRAFITKEIDATTLDVMKEIKKLFDPCNILNPGKLFPKD